MASFELLCVLSILSLVSTQHELIPPHFPNQQYDIRYLSVDGNDSDDCLLSQPYPYNSSVEPCGTLRYALTGGYNLTSENRSNVILLVLPGKYTYGNVTILLRNFQNIVVRKVPKYEGEVIFCCQEYLEDDYNNLYITFSDYIILQEIVFTGCGSLSPGMGTKKVRHLQIINCVYR